MRTQQGSESSKMLGYLVAPLLLTTSARYANDMKIRLQVRMAKTELDEIRAVAAHHDLTVSEWAREALREARRKEARSGVAALERAE